MSVTLNPYIHFDGNAEEVLHFYGSVFGAEPVISRYGDSPEAMEHTPAEFKDLVMHGDIQTDDVRLMVSDSGPMGTPVAGSNFSVSLSGTVADEAKLTEFFNKLSDGGKVTVPLSKAPWGDTFGMCEDKYGIGWMVNVTAA
jgi:PhnB protein